MDLEQELYEPHSRTNHFNHSYFSTIRISAQNVGLKLSNTN